LAARGNPRLGWPLLGIAVAREVAPLVTDGIAWDAIQTLPDLALYLKPELLSPLADRRAHERITRRLGMRQGVPPTIDVRRALHQPWDASGLVLHFEHLDESERHRDSQQVVESVVGADRGHQLMYLALVAPYAADRAAVASVAAGLLDADVPAWYWCTLAAHLGSGAQPAAKRARHCLPPVWAEHLESLVAGPDGSNPIVLPATAHPYGQELLALIAQMGPDDRRVLAREVLNGVVDRWAIDTTLDDVLTPVGAPQDPPVTFAPPAGSPVQVPANVAVHPGDHDGAADPLEDEISFTIALRDGDRGTAPVHHSFVSGADHQLLVSVPPTIAAGAAGALHLTLVHDSDRLTRTLPARVVPPGSSTVVPFSLYVQPDERFVVATLTVRRGDEVLLDAVLLGDVGASPDAVTGGSIRLRRR
jgi:hypothetical protein